MDASFDIITQVETKQICAYCSKSIDMLEETVLLQVVLPAKRDGKMEYYILENDEGGDYAYAPYFFHIDCWVDEVERELHDLLKDDPPVMLCGNSIVTCDGCTSDILPWETSGLLTFGDFQRSQRTPEGVHHAVFVPYEAASTRPLCIACLALINSEVLELWEDGITHRGACEDGIKSRCWRYEVCEDPQEGCRLNQ